MISFTLLLQLYPQILHFGDKVILEDPIERYSVPNRALFWL